MVFAISFHAFFLLTPIVSNHTALSALQPYLTLPCCSLCLGMLIFPLFEWVVLISWDSASIITSSVRPFPEFIKSGNIPCYFYSFYFSNLFVSFLTHPIICHFSAYLSSIPSHTSWEKNQNCLFRTGSQVHITVPGLWYILNKHCSENELILKKRW